MSRPSTHGGRDGVPDSVCEPDEFVGFLGWRAALVTELDAP